MQSVFVEFSNKIGLILEKELKQNKNLVEAYLNHPRPAT